jgi:phospholipid N-methyltransferase
VPTGTVDREYRSFLKQFIRNPKAIGAIAPSSGILARRICNLVQWNEVNAVLEYGPGTGALTKHIVKCLQPETKFLAIEINKRFADMLQQRFPEIQVCQDSVANIANLCRQQGIESVDSILSGLPWASFSERDQNECLGATVEILSPGGQFITFGYLQGLLLPAGVRFRKKLKSLFSEVKMSRPVWANLPPAFIYVCRR